MSLALKAGRGGRNFTRNGAGDPGLFGDIFRGVTGLAKNIPGPIGMAAGAANRLAGKKAPSVPPGGPAWGAGRGAWLAQQKSQAPIPVRTPGIAGIAQRLIPGGATGFQAPAPTAEIGAPSGYHVNETSYYLKDGTFVEKGTRWVKNRRRNPLNPSAASKAISRLESLKRATKRFNRITIRKKSC